MCDYLFSHELASQLTRKIHSTDAEEEEEKEETEVTSAPVVAPGERMSGDETQPTTPRLVQLSYQRGYFFSPQYPSTYPRNIHCSYRFVAKPTEQIRLLFIDVSLQKIDQR